MKVQLTYTAKLDDVPDSVIEQTDKLLKIIEQKKAFVENFKGNVKNRKFLFDVSELARVKSILEDVLLLEQDFDLHLKNIVGVINGLVNSYSDLRESSAEMEMTEDEEGGEYEQK